MDINSAATRKTAGRRKWHTPHYVCKNRQICTHAALNKYINIGRSTHVGLQIWLCTIKQKCKRKKGGWRWWTAVVNVEEGASASTEEPAWRPLHLEAIFFFLPFHWVLRLIWCCFHVGHRDACLFGIRLLFMCRCHAQPRLKAVGWWESSVDDHTWLLSLFSINYIWRWDVYRDRPKIKRRKANPDVALVLFRTADN